MSRPPFAAALTLGLALALAGCAAAPEPGPSPSGFASEEEAFAAAEETYRAYVESLNAADPSDPDSVEAVYQWLSGSALAAAREEFTLLSAEGWTKSGDAVPTLIELREADTAAQTVALDVCLDVSGVDVVDASGESVVDPARADVQTMSAEMATSESTPTALVITEIGGREGEPACAPS